MVDIGNIGNTGSLNGSMDVAVGMPVGENVKDQSGNGQSALAILFPMGWFITDRWEYLKVQSIKLRISGPTCYYKCLGDIYE